MTGDPYQILGVSHDADAEQIKQAYRRLAKQYHPDLHPGDAEAARRMNEINEAYDLIKNPDAYRRQQAQQAQQQTWQTYQTTYQQRPISSPTTRSASSATQAARSTGCISAALGTARMNSARTGKMPMGRTPTSGRTTVRAAAAGFCGEF